MSPAETFYVTTPIYYVNDVPHIGHAYTTIAADAIARYHRLMGRSVHFLTGTDEHGQKIERAAAQRGIPPQALADEVADRFRNLWTTLHVACDDFIRTTEGRHARGVRALWKRMTAAGDVYLDTYTGLYCSGCEAFYLESQLVEGNCPQHHRPPEPLEEESLFFRLSKYQEPLLDYYRAHPDCIRPESRYNEVVRFVEGGLKDLSVSRTSITWGIPVPDHPGHVLYVWLDALSNYVTALGFPETEGSAYSRFWPVDVHLIGKDILRFHAVYWPAFLLSAGLPLPRQVHAHGWWLVDQRKMSKTVRNVVDPAPLVETFGVDALRYFLLRETPFGQDGNFSDEAMVDRFNSDLANDLGNLLSRVHKLLATRCDGTLPPDHGERPLQRDFEEGLARYREAMAGLQFHQALTAVMELVGRVNGYLVETAPWKLPRDAAARPRLETILHNAAAVLRGAAALLTPVMPETGPAIWRQLGLPEMPGNALAGLRFQDLPVGASLGPAAPLFPRVDKQRYLQGAVAPGNTDQPKESTKMSETPAEPSAPEAGEELIDIQHFARVQLRVGQVTEAEKIAGSNKLLKLQVDLGTETRQVVAGIAKQYAPEALVNTRVIIVANLKPAKLFGVESQGMLLAADMNGAPILATFTEEVPPGATVR